MADLTKRGASVLPHPINPPELRAPPVAFWYPKTERIIPYPQTEEQPEQQLWEQLNKARAGMLGIEGSHSHMQPMGHMADKDGAARLWFFTSRSGDLFREMGSGSHAHFCVIGKDQDYHACLMGDLTENRERGKIEQYWSDIVASWFKGKDDPDIALLEFDLMAAIWASTRNPLCVEIQTPELRQGA
jgi:general stress protein 26